MTTEDLSIKKEIELIEFALYEAIYISRYTENKEGVYAVLQVEEAEQMVKDIFEELNKIGYEIVRKHVDLPICGYCRKYNNDLISVLGKQGYIWRENKVNINDNYTLIWYGSYRKYEQTSYYIDYISCDIDTYLPGLKYKDDYKEVICLDNNKYKIIE